MVVVLHAQSPVARASTWQVLFFPGVDQCPHEEERMSEGRKELHKTSTMPCTHADASACSCPWSSTRVLRPKCMTHHIWLCAMPRAARRVLALTTATSLACGSWLVGHPQLLLRLTRRHRVPSRQPPATASLFGGACWLLQADRTVTSKQASSSDMCCSGVPLAGEVNPLEAPLVDTQGRGTGTACEYSVDASGEETSLPARMPVIVETACALVHESNSRYCLTW